MLACLCLVLFGACSQEEDLLPQPEVETVRLIVSVPASSAGVRAVGDPGTAVDEGADWNRLAVILAYTADSQVTLPGGSRVQVTTISKEDFEQLPLYNDDERFRLLAVDAQPGSVFIYGVTYHADATGNPGEAIAACTKAETVQALTISNDYSKAADGTIDYARFVSVATGYYQGDRTDHQPAEFTIQQGGTGQVGTIPTMTLTRLAAKIDIQWDAADAYDQGYTDVKVTQFNYNGKASGRLFPEVTTGTTITNSDESWTFYNTSEISQRNGRVYHYTFPDGVSVPTVTFQITATDKDNNTTTDKPYTLIFPDPLKQAAWYKVNATIKGVTADGQVNVGS